MQDSLTQTYHIYQLIDPRDNLPHYVGITDHPERRFSEHVSGRFQSASHHTWMKELRIAQLEPIMQIIEALICTAQEAQEREKHWIQSYLQAGHPLINKQNRSSSPEEGRQTVYFNDPRKRRVLMALKFLERRDIGDIVSDALDLYVERSPLKSVLPAFLAAQEGNLPLE
jgi:predicted GIY-YIG superfamily endonuclease